jgi:hypothetical protein
MRHTLIAIVISTAFVFGCSDSSNPFSSHKSQDVKEKGNRTVEMRDVPDAVSESFRRDHPAAKADRVERRAFSNGAVDYRIDYTSSDGKTGTVEYNAKGQRANM